MDLIVSAPEFFFFTSQHKFYEATACMAVNLIKVDNFAFLFNCTK